MSNEAYRGPGGIIDAGGEYNRFKFAFDQLANKMATIMPVEVKAVHDATVDVQPAVHQVDPTGKVTPHGTINDVALWQYGAGNAAIILKPVVGDLGICLFAHSDISAVKANQKPSQPGSRRKFDYSDGIYLGKLFFELPEQFIRIDGSGIHLESPTVTTSANLAAGNGASGTFTTPTGQVVTVVSGIITGIV